MRRIMIGLLVTLFFCLIGCTINHEYVPYTNEVYPPKLENSYIPNYNKYTASSCYTIGWLCVWGQQDLFKLQDEFKKIGRQKGADATIGLGHSTKIFQGTYVIPGYTTYETVTSSDAGSFQGNVGMDTFYGTYHGSSTFQLPVKHPSQIIPYSKQYNYVSGELAKIEGGAKRCQETFRGN